MAGGDGFLFFKPNGRSQICPLREEQTQELFNGESVIKCGESRVHLKRFGKVRHAEDGHSSKAKLTVAYHGEETTLTGTLACFC